MTVAGAWGATAPPRDRLIQTAAAEPPRGRVLLATHDPAVALETQCLLREAGYRAVGPATSRGEAERLIAQRARHGCGIDCALVDLASPEAARIAGSLADEAIAFVWLAPRIGPVVLPPLHAGAPVLRSPVDRDEFFAAIRKAMRADDGRQLS